MTATPPTARPFCTWVIAKDYYDGEMAGIAQRDRDRAVIFFRVIAWDREQWHRVFAIAPAKAESVERLRAALTHLEPARQPFWLPGPATHTPEVTSAWNALLADASSARDWTLVESQDLLSAAEETLLSSERAAAVARRVANGTVRDLGEPPILEEFLLQLDTSGK